MAFMASGIPDLNLFLAMALAELAPAGVAWRVPCWARRSSTSWRRVAPTDPNDFWSVARAARAVPRELIEDYVAAAAAVDGPLVPDETESDQP